MDIKVSLLPVSYAKELVLKIRAKYPFSTNEDLSDE